MTHQEILDYPQTFSDCKAKSLREYFCLLLTELWAEGEGFSGKRPFGNSGWEHDVYKALVKSGGIKGVLVEDEDGYSVEFYCNFDKANKLIYKLIKHLCGV
jgi:hypothetical protein